MRIITQMEQSIVSGGKQDEVSALNVVAFFSLLSGVFGGFTNSFAWTKGFPLPIGTPSQNMCQAYFTGLYSFGTLGAIFGTVVYFNLPSPDEDSAFSFLCM